MRNPTTNGHAAEQKPEKTRCGWTTGYRLCTTCFATGTPCFGFLRCLHIVDIGNVQLHYCSGRVSSWIFLASFCTGCRLQTCWLSGTFQLQFQISPNCISRVLCDSDYVLLSRYDSSLHDSDYSHVTFDRTQFHAPLPMGLSF